MNKKLKLKIRYSFIKILSGSDLSKRRLPCMFIQSNQPGPVIWLTACMHGDEVGGTVVIHNLFKKLKSYLLNGTVWAFPLMNPIGFENVTRSISMSNEDLNRSFPGNNNGTLAQRIAYIIFNSIIDTKPDLVFDLHNDWNKSIPYALVDLINSNPDINQRIIDYSKETGLLIVNDTDKIGTTLTYNLVRNNIPAITLELGESYIINEKNVDNGVNAIWNILSKLKMVSCESINNFTESQRNQYEILNYYSKPLSTCCGIIHFLKKPGDHIKRGTKIAKISNAYGKTIETLYCHYNGIILGHSDYAVTYPGAPAMAFGITDYTE